MENTVTKPRDGLYLVSRTSQYMGEEPPCEEAFRVTVVNVDTRYVEDPANLNNPNDWYKRGTNHRVEDGNIKRDLGLRAEWAVEVANLFEFVKKYGQCVVDIDESGFAKLEIYDYYRE